MFETKQYCGLISLKRDMLYYVHCIYTVSSLILTDDSASDQSCFVQGDGKYIQSGVSVEDPEFPLQSGVPRVDVCQSVIGNASCTIYTKLCSYEYTVMITV